MNNFTVNSPFGDKVWPKSTSILCYYCSHKFKGQPLSLPEQYDEKKKLFKVFGVFCSWGCMKSYNNELNDSNNVFRSNLIFLLHGKLEGNYMNINASPPKFSLKCYGGKFTIEEFRKNSSNRKLNYEMLVPPLIPINPLIDKNINFTWVSNDEAVRSFDTFNKSLDDNQLKIKREKKESKNSQNTLEQSMGINVE
jgi:hypothetical protein